MFAQKGRLADQLYSLRRGETAYSFIAEQLRSIALSQKEHSVFYNGELRSFSRHANGAGWVEDGASVRPDVVVCSDAIVFRNSLIPEDAVIIHGGRHGNSFGFVSYE
jgi:hypothetical protein